MLNQSVVSIIDDDQSVRVATGSLVRSLGWEVRVYESGEAFLNADQILDVACIISDVQMPGISGLEMYEVLLEKGAAPPVIFITSFPSEAMYRQAMKLGAICVFSKPVDPVQIELRLEHIGSSGA
ncbi:response regulator [Burkholderia sp. Ac-20384]|uniref:response regulator transcription factor n=1 Tax=Burkholderia sp. Ac-20384 TaxID=2703902 RepID=UPI00197E781C|nr:response regulator [Burkholderia sp. Ac-20384]MBN3827532.1 response regulator [Burkholderia sp. Ac-20384]